MSVRVHSSGSISFPDASTTSAAGAFKSVPMEAIISPSISTSAWNVSAAVIKVPDLMSMDIILCL
jgi:hypothetical protein